ncbi:site-specific integrase [Castellaniella caeni]|uniref:site-specific integrase n=1 Tax=Castellaniella caeni TaxID=266123 RepID=UPI000C9F4951|nr:site-specific integrase [Castellaniella caeni]
MRTSIFSAFGFGHRKLTTALPRNCTLRQALEKYLAEISSQKRSGKQEQSVARVWCRSALADVQLRKIRPGDLVNARDEWLKVAAAGTVVRRLALVSHLYTIARKEWGFEEMRNPVDLIRKPKVRNARERRILVDLNVPGMPASEFDWLLLHSRSRLFRSMMVIAVETAMRRAEVAGLRWENINFERRTAYLPQTKNGHPRTVPLSPRALDELKSWRHGETNSGRVYETSPGAFTRAFNRSRFRCKKRYEDLCRLHGLELNPKYFCNLHLHDLRHEAISKMAPLFQMHELARISGHRDTRMLMRYYHPDVGEFATRLAEAA